MSSQSISFRPTAVIKQIPWRFDRKGALGLFLILVTFSLVGWLYLGQASMITSSTIKIDNLQQEIALLNQQNSELSLEIAELESITRVQERARALGFAPTQPENIRYLSVSDFPALEDQPTADTTVATENQPATEPNWFTYLSAWITGNAE